MEERNLICTACPMGCRLVVKMEGDQVLQIAGNRCRRGESFGRQEAIAPQRMVASTVRVLNGFHPLLPVYTKGTVPKKKIAEVLAEIRKVQIAAPVANKTAIIKNILGTGVDVVASRDMPAKA